MNEEKFDVFLSYSWNSKDKVQDIYRYLTSRNLKVWLDKYNLKGGHLYNEIAHGIENSNVFVCCITKDYCNSDNCSLEINYAKTANKPFVVLMFDRYKEIPVGQVLILINPMIRLNCYRWDNKWSEDNFKNVYDTVIEKLKPTKDAPISKSGNLLPGTAEVSKTLQEAMTSNRAGISQEETVVEKTSTSKSTAEIPKHIDES